MIKILDLYMLAKPGRNYLKAYSLVECERCHKERVIGKYVALKGENNICISCNSKGNTNTLGRKHTEESKALMRKVRESLVIPEESRKRMGQRGSEHHMFGKIISEETREKLRLSSSSRRHTQATKEKISLSKLGEKNPMFGMSGKLSPSFGRPGHRLGKKATIETILKISGANSHLWNPNLTQEDRIKNRITTEYSIWKREVKKRDNYTCQITGQKGGWLVSHHLDGYHWAKDKRHALNNGITILEILHRIFHKIYGIRNNTIEQFEEFKIYITEALCL